MKTMRLGDIATYINGYAFKPEDRDEKGLPIIRIQDLTGSFDNPGFYDGDYPAKVEINDGDILISWSASLGVYIWNRGKALLNQHIFKVVFDKAEVDKMYFVFAIQYYLKEMERKTHGATMKHIVKKDFDNTEIPFPKIEKQIKIAKELSTISRMIEYHRQQLQKLDELVKSRFIELFGDPVYNTLNLPTKPLSELGSLDRGRSKHRPRNDPRLLGGPYPLIQTAEVSNAGLYITGYQNTYSELGLKQSKMWKAGTLCITIAANIAQTAILTFDACFPDSVVGFIPTDEINIIYMHYWFSFFQKILDEQAPQVAQKNINLKILSELQVAIPSIEEQSDFATFVEQVDKSKFAVQQALDKAQLLFDSLMQKHFEQHKMA